MGYLIDSGVFIELERRGLVPSAIAIVAPRDNIAEDDISISSITVSELLAGVYRAEDSARRTARASFVETVLSSTTVLAFDTDVARIHARIWADLTRTGLMVGANDLIIAATAVAHRLPLFTDNVREFTRVRGLIVLQPRWDMVS